MQQDPQLTQSSHDVNQNILMYAQNVCIYVRHVPDLNLELMALESVNVMSTVVVIMHSICPTLNSMHYEIY